MFLQEQYHGIAACQSHTETGDHLRECVLAQNHAAAAHHSCEYEHEAEPRHGVEHEDDGECYECSCHAADGCRVGGYLPPHVYQCAEYLYDECRHEYVAHEMGNVEAVHHIVAGEVAEYGDDVGHHAAFLLSELYECPSLVMAVEVYDESGHEYGEEIHHCEHGYLVGPRHQTEIAEREEGYQSDERQIEWREHHAEYACGEDNVLFFHILIPAFLCLMV